MCDSELLNDPHQAGGLTANTHNDTTRIKMLFDKNKRLLCVARLLDYYLIYISDYIRKNLANVCLRIHIYIAYMNKGNYVKLLRLPIFVSLAFCNYRHIGYQKLRIDVNTVAIVYDSDIVIFCYA